MEQVKKRCMNCRWAMFQDHGYSNWTVESTELHCMLSLNPNLPADYSYTSSAWGGLPAKSYNEINSFAEECKAHEFGDPPSLDVDREDVKEKTPISWVSSSQYDYSHYCGDDVLQAVILNNYMK